MPHWRASAVAYGAAGLPTTWRYDLFSIHIHTTWVYRAGGSPPVPHGDSAGGDATVRDGGGRTGALGAAGTTLGEGGPVVAVACALVRGAAGPVAVVAGDTERAATCGWRPAGAFVQR